MCLLFYSNKTKNSYYQDIIYYKAVLNSLHLWALFYNFFSNINTANHENWRSWNCLHIQKHMRWYKNPFCALCTIILIILKRLRVCKCVWWWMSVCVQHLLLCMFGSHFLYHCTDWKCFIIKSKTRCYVQKCPVGRKDVSVVLSWSCSPTITSSIGGISQIWHRQMKNVFRILKNRHYRIVGC